MKRCIIYTRKSTEERLDMRYNSLEAQRDACLAYIRSQRHNDWEVSPQDLSDGGFSGGNLNRPGLRHLIELVEGNAVDLVVVHKVDRLSRSLIDFAKLVELFDRHNVSFVSVTQNLDTSTSMGRLSLNVLLSFAQFEREIASERIREKIAASRRKGLWTGGKPPLGYAVRNKCLVPIEKEAASVGWIFDTYLATGSVPRVQRLAEVHLGRRMLRGPLYTILRNPIYIGKLRADGELAEGIHDPILPIEVWQEAQRLLAANTRKGRQNRKSDGEAKLLGKLFSRGGRALTRSKTYKHKKIYSYYISRRSRCGKNEAEVDRIPCELLDSLVVQRVRKEVSSREWTNRMVEASAKDPAAVRKLLMVMREDASDDQIYDSIIKVTIDKSSVEIEFCSAEYLNTRGVANSHISNSSVTLTLQWPKRRRGRPIVTSSVRLTNDQDWLDFGRKWFTMLVNGRASSQSSIAAAEGVSQATVSRAIQRALSPPS